MKQLNLYTLVFTFALLFGCSEDSSNFENSSGINYPDTLISNLSYVAIGASDTVGATPQTNGYVYLINNDLKEFVGSVDFTNLGIVGLLVDEMIGQEVDNAISKRPDLVTIWTGGNDFNSIMIDAFTQSINLDLSAFETGVKALLDSLSSSLPNTKIIIANLPNLPSLPVYNQYPSALKTIGEKLITDMNIIIKDAATENGCTLVDLYSNSTFVLDRTNISDDGFHPSNSGYKIMADEFMKEIVKLY